MNPRVYWISLGLAICLLTLIIRLIQERRLHIAYCWIWVSIGALAPVIVVKFDWLLSFSNLIGAISPINTLFLFAILVLFLLSLQFSIVITSQRRQIKKLTQKIVLISEGGQE